LRVGSSVDRISAGAAVRAREAEDGPLLEAAASISTTDTVGNILSSVEFMSNKSEFPKPQCKGTL
jgi:hypothetical protein